MVNQLLQLRLVQCVLKTILDEALIVKNDPKEFALEINNLLNSKSLRNKIQEISLEVIYKNFNFKTCHESLYKSILL